MKSFVKNYLQVLATAFTGLVFIISSFYLLINFNHAEELKRKIFVSSENFGYQNYNETLNKISNNLLKYRTTRNTEYQNMYNYLSNCYSFLKSEGTLSTIKIDRYYGPIDIYNLGTSFQSEAINKCWAANLSHIKDDNMPLVFKNVSQLVENNISINSNQIKDVLSEIQNNNSYFYTTNITSATIRNYLISDYNKIIDSYNNFANILLSLSELMNKGGN